MSVFGVHWFGWSREPRRWMLQLFFISIAWQDRTLWLALGGAPLALILSSRGDFSLCLGNRDEGFRTKGASTILILLALALISRGDWCTILLGLFLLWLAEYFLPEGR